MIYTNNNIMHIFYVDSEFGVGKTSFPKYQSAIISSRDIMIPVFENFKIKD